MFFLCVPSFPKTAQTRTDTRPRLPGLRAPAAAAGATAAPPSKNEEKPQQKQLLRRTLAPWVDALEQRGRAVLNFLPGATRGATTCALTPTCTALASSGAARTSLRHLAAPFFLCCALARAPVGYNKHFVNNTFVYADYSPAVHRARKLGRTAPLSAPEWPPSSSSGRMGDELGDERRAAAVLASPHADAYGNGNGYGTCASSIASFPFIALGKEGLQEQWWNNTCIASSEGAFFDWCA